MQSSIKMQSRAGSIHRWDGADERFALSWMEAACRGVSEAEVPSFIAADPPHTIWWKDALQQLYSCSWTE